MILSLDETIDTIERLLLLYAPNDLDRQNVFDSLGEHKLFLAPKQKCPDCGEEMFCPNCGVLDISSAVSVRINGRERYSK